MIVLYNAKYDWRFIAVRQNASKYLKDLEEIGVLKSQKCGKETVYLNTELVKVLSKQ